MESVGANARVQELPSERSNLDESRVPEYPPAVQLVDVCAHLVLLIVGSAARHRDAQDTEAVEIRDASQSSL